jgi:hypothetical protein
LSHEDASRLLTSTSTTVIRTEARAQGETHVAGTEAIVGKTTQTVEQQQSSSSSSSKASSSAAKTSQ